MGDHVSADVWGMSNDRRTCKLCGDLDAHVRPGRLGRYSQTCDACEQRRGSHLDSVGSGYGSREVHARTLVG